MKITTGAVYWKGQCQLLLFDFQSDSKSQRNYDLNSITSLTLHAQLGSSIKLYHACWEYARSKITPTSWLGNVDSPPQLKPASVSNVQWFDWIMWVESSRNMCMEFSSNTYPNIRAYYMSDNCQTSDYKKL